MKERCLYWLRDHRVLCGLWIIIGFVSAVTKLSPTRHNNYDIFRYVFYNTWNGESLYAQSTDGGFWDINHYGPLFSLIIAPFAVMPVWMGMILWCTLLAAFLYWAACKHCSLENTYSTKAVDGYSYIKPFMIWFCAHELLTALFMQQFNVAIAGILLLSFYYVEQEKDQYATLFIVIGTLVKLYGIVGIAFFFFSKHKLKYILSLLGWSVLLVCLPMLISSPEYQLSQYQEWVQCLSEKNDENLLAMSQNISLLGLVRKFGYNLTGDAWWAQSYQDIYLILAGMITMAIGYFRIGQWKNPCFRHTVLAAVLMFVCLFSTGTESSGYIIALIGCVIWYCAVPWKRTKLDVALMTFAFILTSLSPSDLFPKYLKQEFVQPYALKALPVAIIWIKLCYEFITKKYDTIKL